MANIDLAPLQPFIFTAAIIFAVALAWALIRGAIGAVLTIAALAAVAYGLLWWWTGQQPIVPSAFGAWLDDLPDTVGSWITQARAWFET